MIKMKDSGIPWIGQIPENWEFAKYKFFASFYNGNSIKDEEKKEFEEITNTPYISTKDIDKENSKINYNNGLYIKEKDIDFRIAHKDSCLICIEGGSAGKKIGFLTKDVAFVNKLCCVNPKMINDKFSYYILLSDYFNTNFNLLLSGLIGGVTVNQIKNINIAIPPKEIQQKIVEILDKKCGQIDELVSLEENEIEKLKEYKTSLITKVVTKGLDHNAKMKDSGIPWIGQIPESWIVAKIKNVVEICNGKEVEDNDGEVLVYGSGGIFGKTSKIMYDNESVLLGRKGTVDRPIYLKDIKFWCVDTMFYTKSKNLILMKLFYYIMFIFDYKPYIYGTALPSMSQSILNEIYIPLAKNVVQQQIVEYLDKMCEEIDNLIKIKQEKIEKLKEYKKSLIYQYVTGKKEVV